MLRAQGERAARYLTAEGEAAAIAKVEAAMRPSSTLNAIIDAL